MAGVISSEAACTPAPAIPLRTTVSIASFTLYIWNMQAVTSQSKSPKEKGGPILPRKSTGLYRGRLARPCRERSV